MRRLILWTWVGVVGAGGLFVLFAVQQADVSARAGGIALGFWVPAATTLLGTLVALRQPGNRIAWLLIGIGSAVLIEFFVQIQLSTKPDPLSSIDLAAIALAYAALPAAMYLAFLVPLMFPNGRFLTRRQGVAAWTGGFVLLVAPAVTMLSEEIGPPYPPAGQAWTVENPVGFLPSSAADAAAAVTIGLLVLTAVAGVFSLARRYRQSSVVTRAQIRWIGFSTSIVIGVLLIVITTGAWQSAVGALLLVVAFTSMPVSITVAITRYRLFEIDRIISRTINYAIVVAVLAAAFFGLVALITVLLPTQGSLAVAASTLAIAALFNPLRKRVQKTIDRRFNRSAYQAEVIGEAFSSRLRASLTAERIIEDWLQTVNESLEPETSGVWIRYGNLDGPE